jgi:hypothetical protein
MINSPRWSIRPCWTAKIDYLEESLKRWNGQDLQDSQDKEEENQSCESCKSCPFTKYIDRSLEFYLLKRFLNGSVISGPNRPSIPGAALFPRPDRRENLGLARTLRERRDSSSRPKSKGNPGARSPNLRGGLSDRARATASGQSNRHSRRNAGRYRSRYHVRQDNRKLFEMR